MTIKNIVKETIGDACERMARHQNISCLQAIKINKILSKPTKFSEKDSDIIDICQTFVSDDEKLKLIKEYLNKFNPNEIISSYSELFKELMKVFLSVGADHHCLRMLVLTVGDILQSKDELLSGKDLCIELMSELRMTQRNKDGKDLFYVSRASKEYKKNHRRIPKRKQKRIHINFDRKTY